MADRPIPEMLPADLPEDWVADQIISPNGGEAGLDERHGYNYQSKQINAAQRGVNTLNGAMPSKADLDPETHKVLDSQMPPMDYAPTNHTHTWGEVRDKPDAFAPSAHAESHGAGGSDPLTAAGIGADPAGAGTDAVAAHNAATDNHVDIRLAVETAQLAADAALEIITSIAHTIDVVPSQSGSLTYTGWAQSPAWSSYNPEVMTLGGVTTGTNAGTYTATFAPKADYHWADGSTAGKSVSWSIGRAAIGAVPSQSGGLTYSGAAQSPTWSGYNSAQMTLGGMTSGTNAGSYAAAFTPTGNYRWSDGATTAKSVGWSIGRAAISAVPSQSGGLTYTGGAQSPTWANYNSGQLTIGGTTSSVNAGSYMATFTPTGNYRWSDGGTAAKSVGWSIAKAVGSLTLDKTAMTLTNGALTGIIAVTRAGDGAVSATSSNTGIATVSVSGTTVTVTGKAYGNATITVSVAAGSNHNAPASKTCAVTANIYNTTLNSNSWERIRTASDAGLAASIWSVGATKAITINGSVGETSFSNLTIDVFIIGINHNAAREGANRIHFQIGKIGGAKVGLVGRNYGSYGNSSSYFQMNVGESNSGGWNGSSMRKTLLGNNGTPTSPTSGSLLAAFPADLRSVIKSCTKYSDNTGGGSDTASYVTGTIDYLFLLSEFEYHGARSWANSAEQNYQAQYDYYRAGNSKVHYKHSTMAPAIAWCRSVSSRGTMGFLTVETNGGVNIDTADLSNALAPGFCV